MASQAPVILKNRGRMSRDSTINTRVRRNEMIADTRPLDRAVKKPEEAMLKPLNRKLKAKIRKPASASVKVSGSMVKTETRGVEEMTAIAVRATEEASTKRNEVR